jgi:hypothetical protein
MDEIIERIIYCLIDMLYIPKYALTYIELDNDTRILINNLYDIVNEYKELCDVNELRLLERLLKHHELI